MIDKFLVRTTQGSQALLHAVKKAKTEPERAGYLLAAEANIGSKLAALKTLDKITKPALMPLLGGAVFRSRKTHPDYLVGLAALTGVWVGDSALLKSNSIGKGTLGCAVNQAGYVYLLLKRGARPSMGRVAVRAVPLALATAFAAWKAPKSAPVVGLCGSLLGAVSVLADDPALISDDDPASFGIGHGGNLLLISGSILLAQEVLLSEKSFVDRIAGVAVMETYTIA